MLRYIILLNRSGSTYAYGVLDTYYKHDLELEEAVELGLRAIYHATFRDSGSGGVCRGKYYYHVIVYHIHEKGWTRVYEGEDVNKLHYKFAE